MAKCKSKLPWDTTPLGWLLLNTERDKISPGKSGETGAHVVLTETWNSATSVENIMTNL